MAGDVYFRKDIDKTVFCILHQLADVVLSIEAAIVAGFVRVRGGKSAECSDSFSAPGAYLCKAGQAFYLDAPAFVIGEMHMKQVEFVFRHLVDKVFYLLFCKEVTVNVEHQSAPAEAGIVGDGRAGDLPASLFY